MYKLLLLFTLALSACGLPSEAELQSQVDEAAASGTPCGLATQAFYEARCYWQLAGEEPMYPLEFYDWCTELYVASTGPDPRNERCAGWMADWLECLEGTQAGQCGACDDLAPTNCRPDGPKF